MGENGALLKVLTVGEAAKYLKLTTKEVSDLAKEGRIPGQQVGSKWRFLKSALVEWLRTGKSRNAIWDQFGVFKDDETMPELMKIIEENRRRDNEER